MLQEYLAALLHVLPAIIGFHADNFALLHPMADVLLITTFFNDRRASIDHPSLSGDNGKHHDGGGSDYSVTDHFEPSSRLNPQQDYPATSSIWQAQSELNVNSPALNSEEAGNQFRPFRMLYSSSDDRGRDDGGGSS